MRRVVTFFTLLLVLVGFVTVDAWAARAAFADAVNEGSSQISVGVPSGNHDEQPADAPAPCESDEDEDETDEDDDDANDEAFVATSRSFERRVGNVQRWRLAQRALAYAFPAVEPAPRPPRA